LWLETHLLTRLVELHVKSAAEDWIVGLGSVLLW
jgi:hypothetical protein